MALGNGMRWGGRVVAAQLLLKAMLSGGPMKTPEQNRSSRLFMKAQHFGMTMAQACNKTSEKLPALPNLQRSELLLNWLH